MSEYQPARGRPGAAAHGRSGRDTAHYAVLSPEDTIQALLVVAFWGFSANRHCWSREPQTGLVWAPGWCLLASVLWPEVCTCSQTVEWSRASVRRGFCSHGSCFQTGFSFGTCASFSLPLHVVVRGHLCTPEAVIVPAAPGESLRTGASWGRSYCRDLLCTSLSRPEGLLGRTQ